MSNFYDEEVTWDENGNARLAVWFTDEEMELINKCSNLTGKSVDEIIKEGSMKLANRIKEESKGE